MVSIIGLCVTCHTQRQTHIYVCLCYSMYDMQRHIYMCVLLVSIIGLCDMSYTTTNTYICVFALFNVWYVIHNDTYICVYYWSLLLVCVTCYIQLQTHICVFVLFNVWYVIHNDTYICVCAIQCVTCLPLVWHASVICVAWLILVRDITHAYVSMMSGNCNVTCSHVWHDSFMCVICHPFHGYAWHWIRGGTHRKRRHTLHQKIQIHFLNARETIWTHI